MQITPNFNNNRMQISSNSNRQANNVKFKAVNLVQIPKAAFTEPDNTLKCALEFNDILSHVTKDPLGNSALGQAISYATTKLHKTATVLEKFSHFTAKTSSEIVGKESSVSKLREKTGLPIADAVDETKHSFYVFTKEHKDKCAEIQRNSLTNLQEAARESQEKYPNDIAMQDIYAYAKVGVEADKQMEEIISNTPIKKIEIDSLFDIASITKDLDI